MVRIVVCVAVLCVTAALIVTEYRAKGNPDSVFAKALFRVKSARFFPVLSLAHVFYLLVVLFFALQIVDLYIDKGIHFREDSVKIRMTNRKYTKEFEYQLLALKGREAIGEKTKPRILVLGDSYTWGHGLSNINQIWWNIMARELEDRGYDCEVYAVAVGGASTYDEYLWLRDTTLLEDIQPDLIVLGFVHNDTDLSNVEGYQAPQTAGPSGLIKADLDWMRPVFPAVYDYLILFNYAFRSIDDFRHHVTVEDHLYKKENLEMFSAQVLRPLGELVREAGIPLLVVPLPTEPNRGYYEPRYGAVFPLFEQAGLSVYSPYGKLMEQYENLKYKDLLYINWIDTHPGPAASWMLGRYAADAVEQKYAPIMTKNGNGGGQSTYLIEINDWMPYEVDPRPIWERDTSSRYGIFYPSRITEEVPFIGPFGGEYFYDGFLRLSPFKKYVKLNFKYPFQLAGVIIDGGDLRSAEVYTLAVNETLGFDDQHPVSLGKCSGGRYVWSDGGGRYVTSLLISAKPKRKNITYLTITIVGSGGKEAFY